MSEIIRKININGVDYNISPIASEEQLGMVKLGPGLDIDGGTTVVSGKDGIIGDFSRGVMVDEGWLKNYLDTYFDFSNIPLDKGELLGTLGNTEWRIDKIGRLFISAISGTDGVMGNIECGNYGFDFNRDNLTEVIIDLGVTTIGEYAFFNCSLESIEIPNSVTSIGYEAFYYCRNLTSITIPYSVTNIGNYAFGNCTGLSKITCLAEVPPTIQSNTFYNVNKSIPLYVPAESVNLYNNATGWRGFTNIQAI